MSAVELRVGNAPGTGWVLWLCYAIAGTYAIVQLEWLVFKVGVCRWEVLSNAVAW